jgi:hypothetical protein
MLVRILRNKGYYDYVKPQMLDRLIETEEIVRFYRASGPVVLGVDPVRRASGPVVLGVDPVRRTQNKAYGGDERRRAA